MQKDANGSVYEKRLFFAILPMWTSIHICRSMLVFIALLFILLSWCGILKKETSILMKDAN